MMKRTQFQWMKMGLPIVAVSLAAGLAACTAMDSPEYTPDPNALKIGLLGDFSGGNASLEQAIMEGARLAAKEINAVGGVNGQSIDFVFGDDRCDGTFSPGRAQYLANQGVVGILGGLCSGATRKALAAATTPLTLPFVSASATNPTLTQGTSDNPAFTGRFFRSVPSDAFQGIALAQKIKAENVNTVSIIYLDSAYGVGLEAAFEAAYTTAGGTINAKVEYSQDKTVGFGTEVAQLFASGTPSGIVLITYIADGANITKDLKSYMTNNNKSVTHFYGVDGNYGPDFLANGDPTILSQMKGTNPSVDQNLATWQTFHKNFTAYSGVDTTGNYLENSYDAVYLMALAMQKGQKNTSANIIANIQSVSKSSGRSVTVTPNGFKAAIDAVAAGNTDLGYEGASGAIDLDNTGSPASGYYVWWGISGGDYTRLSALSCANNKCTDTN